jgi:hypothetical protein
MKLLTEIRYKRTGRYRYVLTADVSYRLPRILKPAKVYGHDGHIYVSWSGDKLTIHAGYAWDWATLYPDHEGNKAAALLHDALYQMSSCWNCPFTRGEADWYFRQLQKNKIERNLTYAGVRAFGLFFWKFGKPDLTIIFHQ